ncbi:MAG: hypothetical protein K2W82_17000 [Candidatus Obscuribacterales bacterium]|nr:hypothetical protein [Candidatus Obscuribacterales bacterium]
MFRIPSLLALLLAASLAFAPFCQAAVPTPTNLTANASEVQQVQDIVKEVIDAVPDGSTVTVDDFLKKVSAANVKALVKKLNVTSLSRKGDRLTLNCTAGEVTLDRSFKLNLESAVELDITVNKSATDLLKFKLVKGVTVIAGDKPALGKILLDEISVTKNADGSLSTNLKFAVDATFTSK